ncbi:MAG: ABC transporter ATP-binding protein [Bacteroidales bacterium]|nr:ABC transporter ATP-binding protein [Bacteroidales bacterium]
MSYQIKEVSLVYDVKKDGGTAALRNITLSLNEAGLIAIKGPSGSGKSSLLYTMAGLKKPTSGEVFYNSTDLFSMSMPELTSLRRKEFGFIFQQHYLINYLTVLENTLVPLNVSNESVRRSAMKILERLKMLQYAHKLPHQLSGGQCQRTAIARALINNPKVIFADEPTAALDHKSACEVMEILSEYAKRAMVVFVTHDESLLQYSDQIITINDGEIVSKTKRGKQI